MPRPPVSQTRAIVQKFAIVTHTHPLPTCTTSKHSTFCRKKGIFIGCKRAGRLKRGRDRHGNPVVEDDRYALCSHLRV